MFGLPISTFVTFFIICPFLILAWLLWWGVSFKE